MCGSTHTSETKCWSRQGNPARISHLACIHTHPNTTILQNFDVSERQCFHPWIPAGSLKVKAAWVQIPVEQVTTRIQEVLHAELKRHVDTVTRLARIVLPEKVLGCCCRGLGTCRGRH